MPATVHSPGRTASLTWGFLRAPFAVWLVWRVAQAVALVAFGGDLVDDPFRFDGGWFRSILEDGYAVTDPSFATQQNVAFFPGLVWLTEPLSWVVGDTAAALLVANVTSLTAFVAIYAAVSETIGRAGARWTLIAIAVWPASIVLCSYYSEGLFLTATAGAIWASNRGRGGIAVAAAFAAAVTRSIGVLLGPILAITRVVHRRSIDGHAVALGASGPAGMAVVAGTHAVQVDDPLAFARAQEGWDRAVAAPWVPVWRAVEGIWEKLPSPAQELALNLVAILAVGAALVIVTLWLRRDEPPRWDVLGWGWAAWLAPLLTTVPSSQVRFALSAWPAFSVAGLPTSRGGRALRLAALVGSAGLSLVLIRRWAAGQFIG